MKLGKFIFGAAALSLFAFSGAQITKQGSGYLFRVKFTKGQKTSYLMTMLSDMGAQKVNVTMPMSQTVTAVDKGVATVKVQVGEMKMMLNGKPIQNPAAAAGKTLEIKMNNRGEMVGSGAGSQQTSIPLPAKPVAVGSTWSDSTTVPVAGQPMKVNATYKLLGFEKLGKYNTAKVAVTVKGAGQVTVNGKGTVWLNMSDGSMVKYINDVQTSMGGRQMPMKMTITRQ